MTDTFNSGKRRAIVAALLRLEAVLVMALGAFMVIKALTSESEAPLAAVGVVLFAALGGAGLLLAAKAFATGRNFGRAPAVLANLIALGVAYYQAEAHLWFSAIPLAMVALATLLLALSIIPA